MTFGTLFNLRCPGCDQAQPQGHLCQVCTRFLTDLGHRCALCAEPLQTKGLCGQCLQSAPGWDALHIPWRFDGLTRFLIHRYKYHRDRAAGHALLRHWQPPVHQHGPQALLAVPMHHHKQARFGFNHADDMAQFLSKTEQLPIYRGMTRARSTRPLEGLKKSERKRELNGCFTLKSSPPERVAIIDDVMTTGSTVAEITRTLKRAGTKFVTVWAIARTPLSGFSGTD